MRLAARAFAVLSLCAATSGAQMSGPYPNQPWPPPGPPPAYNPPARSRDRTDLEILSLYGVSAAYGVGIGVWFSSELDIEDPGVFLIPPAVLGAAAPVGVWFLDEPSMPSGMPAAIASGMLIGAGEGIGIASYQFVTADEDDAWGFRGLSRATALGATAGGIAGFAAGYYLEPSPKSSVLMTSSVLWGTTVGALYGYGASEAGVGYGLANDSAGLGGLVGYNVGLVASAALSMVYVPSWDQLAWMWLGGGIGAAVSLPVFLFYAGDEGPPAKRGFLFTATTTTLGIAAGAIFGSDEMDAYELGGGDDRGPLANRWAAVTSFGPMALEGGAGVQVSGTLF